MLALIAFARDMHAEVLLHNLKFFDSGWKIVILLTQNGGENQMVKEALTTFEEYDTDNCFEKYRLYLTGKSEAQFFCFDNTRILTEKLKDIHFANCDFVFGSKKTISKVKLFESVENDVQVFEANLIWVNSSEKFLSIRSWETNMQLENSKSLDLNLSKPRIKYFNMPENFHPARYVNANPDLCGFILPSDAWKHFLIFGYQENRPHYQNQPGNVV